MNDEGLNSKDWLKARLSWTAMMVWMVMMSWMEMMSRTGTTNWIPKTGLHFEVWLDSAVMMG